MASGVPFGPGTYKNPTQTGTPCPPPRAPASVQGEPPASSIVHLLTLASTGATQSLGRGMGLGGQPSCRFAAPCRADLELPPPKAKPQPSLQHQMRPWELSACLLCTITP